MANAPYLNSEHLACAQKLALYSFEIPQDPAKVRSCYKSCATIKTNETSLTLDQFLEYLIQSNTKNVTRTYKLINKFKPFNEDGIKWSVSVEQERLGYGLGESGAGLYKISQVAILKFSNGKVISQYNTLTKTKVEFQA